MKSVSILLLLVVFISPIFSQQNAITILDSGYKTSLRGLSVVDDNIVWASGSSGTVVRSTNGGKSFEWLTVKGFEKNDFRDIEAFDSMTALIMAIDCPAYILKTKDGGKTWNTVFEDTTKGMFLDAMAFANDSSGIVIGDPIQHKIFLALTENGGKRWFVPQGDAGAIIPQAFPDEAFFASSGTNIFINKSQNILSGIFVSGGSVSRFFYNDKIEMLPIIHGKESTGANSVAVDFNNKKAVVVGGDFSNDKDTTQNSVLVNFNNAIRFSHPQTPPHGYRSCVIYINTNQLITCGTSGVDISNDAGLNWNLISLQSFHVCKKAKNGNAVFLAGANGKIGKLSN